MLPFGGWWSATAGLHGRFRLGTFYFVVIVVVVVVRFSLFRIILQVLLLLLLEPIIIGAQNGSFPINQQETFLARPLGVLPSPPDVLRIPHPPLLIARRVVAVMQRHYLQGLLTR